MADFFLVSDRALYLWWGQDAQVSLGRGWEGTSGVSRAPCPQSKSSNAIRGREAHRNLLDLCPHLRAVDSGGGGVDHTADSPDGVDSQLFERPQVSRHPADAHEGLVEIVGQASGPKGRGVV